jgi:ADP-ribosylation factor protein 6
MRPYWRHYYTGTQGIIFVVDASDTNRLDAAAAELRTLAADGQLFDAAILVLANKSDIKNALTAADISKRMNLPMALAGHPWHIQNSVASTGAGIEEGLVFLAENMKAL